MATKRQRPLRAERPTVDKRRVLRAMSSLEANAEKRRELAHLLDLAERERDRLLLHGYEVGCVQASMAIITGVSEGRVWQVIRAEKDKRAAKEAADGKEAKK
jgi:hypothetical protein